MLNLLSAPTNSGNISDLIIAVPPRVEGGELPPCCLTHGGSAVHSFPCCRAQDLCWILMQLLSLGRPVYCLPLQRNPFLLLLYLSCYFLLVDQVSLLLYRKSVCTVKDDNSPIHLLLVLAWEEGKLCGENRCPAARGWEAAVQRAVKAALINWEQRVHCVCEYQVEANYLILRSWNYL